MAAPSEMTALAQYRDVVEFVHRLDEFRPTKKDENRVQQLSHLTTLLNKCDVTHAHATEVMDAMTEDSCPWNASQKIRITELLTTMIDARAEAGGSGKQDHQYIQHYLTAHTWSVLQNDDIAWRMQLL